MKKPQMDEGIDGWLSFIMKIRIIAKVFFKRLCSVL